MSTVEVLSGADDLRGVLELRYRVFVDEQHVPVSDEIDAIDYLPDTYHVVVTNPDSAQAIGTGRVFCMPRSTTVHIGRVAVAASWRGRGVGRLVMKELARIAQEKYQRSPLTIELAAQVAAVPFYEKLGYDVVDHRIVMDAGIAHKIMSKTMCED